MPTLTADPDTVIELPRRATGDAMALVRAKYNRAAMIAWINADLLARASHDVRKSIVLYDADGDFMMALLEMPDADALRRVRAATRVRFYSKGVR
jgi:hypothetical protein